VPLSAVWVAVCGCCRRSPNRFPPGLIRDTAARIGKETAGARQQSAAAARYSPGIGATKPTTRRTGSSPNRILGLSHQPEFGELVEIRETPSEMAYFLALKHPQQGFRLTNLPLTSMIYGINSPDLQATSSMISGGTLLVDGQFPYTRLWTYSTYRV
jgi:hypothetical protein